MVVMMVIVGMAGHRGKIGATGGRGREPFPFRFESERSLYFFVLTRFLNANRHPLRSKTLQRPWALAGNITVDNLSPAMSVRLEHDPEKWKPVFRKDHAQTKR